MSSKQKKKNVQTASQPATAVTTPRQWAIFGVIVLAAVLLDQGTKQAALHHLQGESFFTAQFDHPICGNKQDIQHRLAFIERYRTEHVLIDGLLELRYAENCGSAFSMLAGVSKAIRVPFFVVISLLALVGVPYLFRKTPPEQRFMRLALPLILAGAVGNFIDRMIYVYVIDFIRMYVTIGGKEKAWPTYNVADIALVAGLMLVVLQWISARRAA